MLWDRILTGWFLYRYQPVSQLHFWTFYTAAQWAVLMAIDLSSFSPTAHVHLFKWLNFDFYWSALTQELVWRRRQIVAIVLFCAKFKNLEPGRNKQLGLLRAAACSTVQTRQLVAQSVANQTPNSWWPVVAMQLPVELLLTSCQLVARQDSWLLAQQVGCFHSCACFLESTQWRKVKQGVGCRQVATALPDSWNWKDLRLSLDI